MFSKNSVRLVVKNGRVCKVVTPIETAKAERNLEVGVALTEPAPEVNEQPAKPKRAPRKKREA